MVPQVIEKPKLIQKTVIFPDEGEYFGHVRESDGVREGYGVMKYTYSNFVYGGDWKDGMRHGYGTLKYRVFDDEDEEEDDEDDEDNNGTINNVCYASLLHINFISFQGSIGNQTEAAGENVCDM